MSDLWEQFRNYFLKNTTLIHQTGTLDKKIRTVVHLLLTGRPFNRKFAAHKKFAILNTIAEYFIRLLHRGKVTLAKVPGFVLMI